MSKQDMERTTFPTPTESIDPLFAGHFCDENTPPTSTTRCTTKRARARPRRRVTPQRHLQITREQHAGLFTLRVRGKFSALMTVNGLRRHQGRLAQKDVAIRASEAQTVEVVEDIGR
jgi:hypothetical protein